MTSQTGMISRPLSSVPITPPYLLKSVLGPDGKYVPLQSSAPVGYTPAQVRGAYGVNLVSFGNVIGDGTGQTIAVIDVGDNTGFQDTGPTYPGSSLAVFDKTLGLPDPPSFQKFNQTGGKTLPAPVAGWGVEIALDVEWAHSIAPGAKIDLVEATEASSTDLYTAMQTAGTTLGASVISMSFGASLEGDGLRVDGAATRQPVLCTDSGRQSEPDVACFHRRRRGGRRGINPGPSYPSISPYVDGHRRHVALYRRHE